MQIAVVGVGLIGGSIALAGRDRLGATVVGYDSNERALRAAVERGALDRACGTLAEAAADAEAVFVAVPVSALPGAATEALATGVERGALDGAADSVGDAVAGAEAVFCAAPVARVAPAPAGCPPDRARPSACSTRARDTGFIR